MENAPRGGFRAELDGVPALALAVGVEGEHRPGDAAIGRGSSAAGMSGIVLRLPERAATPSAGPSAALASRLRTA